MPRAVPLLVAAVGLGLCVLSFLDARAQQSWDASADQPPAPAHTMHGWSHS